MLLWLTARMNCLCTCCKRKHKPLGVHYRGSCCFPSSPNRIDGPGQGDGMPCWAFWLGLMPWASCCFRALFLTSCQGSAQIWLTGEQEQEKRGVMGRWGGGGSGVALLSHHSHIIRRTACLQMCTNLICGLQRTEITSRVMDAPVSLHSEKWD